MYLFAALLTLGAVPATPAEASGFTKTATHAEVQAFGTALAAAHPSVTTATFGTSHAGRPMPVLVLADPPAKTPADVAGRPVVLAFANIHAGEVDGKDALLALARDLAVDKVLLKKMVVVLVPNLNPDGNEAIAPKNRPGQNGPADVGTRENAQGFDLNRDFVKLESPEVRALVKLIAAWDPLLIVDCHTTNGSYHRYTLTYDGPRNPAADSRLIDFAQAKLLPDLTKRVKASTGFDTFPYGNFSADRTKWESYPAQPRFGVQSFALRGRIGLLSESYTYASFADRVTASYAFVKAAFDYVAEHTDEVKAIVAEASKPATRVALRTKTVAAGAPTTVLGYEEISTAGKRSRTDTHKDYPVTLVTKVEPSLEVELPAAYVIPPGFPAAIECLQRHGIVVEELTEDRFAAVQSYTVTDLQRAKTAFQKHNLTTLEVSSQKSNAMLPVGGVLVRTAQPLGTWAAYLLEPQADDGLAAWNFFDVNLAIGNNYPVLRLPMLPALATAPLAPLQDEKPKKKPVTLEVLLSGRGGGGPGGFAPATDWLPDGEHFLQARQGKLLKVNARTGEGVPFVDPDKLRNSLKALKDLSPTTVDQLSKSAFFRMNKDRTGTLIDIGPDVGFAYFDGTPAVRITKSGAGKEYLSLSPSGKHVAFVRGANLYAADLATGTERKLTADGGGEILNAKADWVYEEEIFNRNGKSFWWSPDGTKIAFLRYDDTPVKKFRIAIPFPASGGLEEISYPKPGDPNPTVKLGIALADGGPVTFLDLSGYPADDTLISRVGWLPTGVPFAYVQNRIQTWLDFVTWPDLAGKPVKLFRDATKAWIEDLGEPKFFPDGTFVVPSERSGWKHLYHYQADGTLIGPLTSGEWEVQSVERLEADGSVWLTGTKDGHTRTHLYRAKGGAIERLTAAGGTHRVSVPPAGPLFIDRFGDNDTPTQSALFEVNKGKVRTLDATTPKESEYALGKTVRHEIKLKDGFVLEGSLTYPPDFDPAKKYPIWTETYAGPHAPTIRDGFAVRMFDQVLATAGIVVFRVDPRSASGKGAVSAWTCYKQLGVQELKDLEEAVDWVCQNPWADATRVGLSGHSYGGYITAYALTHSKVFSAGIAGAPVTDWSLYDTIYTERYMGLPKDNKEGYEKSSVVKAAANLHGRLLLIHGMMDDNVHLQNSAQLIDALQRAGKQFDLMVYPRSRHGIGGAHYQRLQIEFIFKTMGIEKK